MADIIIVLIVVVLLGLALKSSVKHFKGEGACCGGGSKPEIPKKKLDKTKQGEKTMKMYKKVMAAALAGVMTVSMSATAFAADDDGYILKATNEDSKSSDNDLVIAIEGSVSSMDPANIPDTNAISATRGVYETLVSFDENQELTGKLAESWEVSDDSLTYTFKLRQGVKFQDGTDFNAAAVKANYDRVVNKDNNLRQRRTFIVTNEDGSETPRVDSIETPDDNTLVINLTQAWHHLSTV